MAKKTDWGITGNLLDDLIDLRQPPENAMHTTAEAESAAAQPAPVHPDLLEAVRSIDRAAAHLSAYVHGRVIGTIPCAECGVNDDPAILASHLQSLLGVAASLRRHRARIPFDARTLVRDGERKVEDVAAAYGVPASAIT